MAPEQIEKKLYFISVDIWSIGILMFMLLNNGKHPFYVKGINKTDFSNWAYQKYRQLQEMHITTRSWYRLAIEDMKLNNMIDGV